MKNKVVIDGRLLSCKPTGISRYCIKMLEVIAKRYDEEQLVVLVNDTRVVEQSALLRRLNVKKTRLRAFNMLHWFILSLWVFVGQPKAYICLNYSGLCFKRKSLELTVTVYDLMFAFVKGFFGGGLRDVAGRLYYGVMVSRAIGISDLVLTISEASKADIWRLYSKKSHNMAGGNFLEAEPSLGFVDRLGLVAKKYFIYAGNARPHKNIPQLLRVFARYRIQEPSSVLVIVGHSGPSGNGIIYPGFVSDEELVALYQSAKALVFPSVYEGFGLPVLEAIANGCPVLASNIPAFQEFENGNMAFFNEDDELFTLLDGEYKFNEVEREAFLERFNWSVFDGRLLKAFPSDNNLC